MSSVNGPSIHLSWRELRCKDGTSYPAKYIEDGRVFVLAAVFERLRQIMGDRSIKILSAYRTSSYNKKIGGAKNSQHLVGRALDLATPPFKTVDQFYDKVKENAEYIGIRGLGRYPWGIHIDIRPSKVLVLWGGHGTKDSLSTTKRPS